MNKYTAAMLMNMKSPLFSRQAALLAAAGAQRNASLVQ